ncbi:hypothetical protein, partial [uncultured Selenomonas sp.]|uniref:hypothetical protein n=1 Tax=uncultured Selenomonas sp. TaxID=159275 RepID=UPI0025FDF087
RRLILGIQERQTHEPESQFLFRLLHIVPSKTTSRIFYFCYSPPVSLFPALLYFGFCSKKDAILSNGIFSEWTSAFHFARRCSFASA